MKEHIIITDDKGVEHIFHDLKELINYLDSFKMSFLPDNFSYEIKTNKLDDFGFKKEVISEGITCFTLDSKSFR
jgi:hypothetical protein